MASFCSWERTGLVILPVYKLNEATASPRRMVSVTLGLMSLTRLIFIRPGDAFEIIKSEKSKCARQTRQSCILSGNRVSE